MWYISFNIYLPCIGDGGEDYLNLALKDGGISLSINLGSGTLDTGIGQISKDEKKTVRFDDDQWHHISIKRVAQEVSRKMFDNDNRKVITSIAFNVLKK